MKEKVKIGAWGEEFACQYLGAKGYNVVERNIKLGNQEIDIIAFKEDNLVIVEVKTTTSRMARAEDMVNKHKLKNLKIGAVRFISRFKVRYRTLRFDLLALNIDKVAKSVKIRHYKDII